MKVVKQVFVGNKMDEIKSQDLISKSDRTKPLTYIIDQRKWRTYWGIESFIHNVFVSSRFPFVYVKRVGPKYRGEVGPELTPKNEDQGISKLESP